MVTENQPCGPDPGESSLPEALKELQQAEARLVHIREEEAVAEHEIKEAIEKVERAQRCPLDIEGTEVPWSHPPRSPRNRSPSWADGTPRRVSSKWMTRIMSARSNPVKSSKSSPVHCFGKKHRWKRG